MRYSSLFSIVLALFIPLYISGCTSFTELPAGTRISVGEPPSGVVNRQIVEVPASAASPYQPADYLIGPNDVLAIAINGSSDFTNSGSMGSSGSMVISSTGSSSKVSGSRVDGRGCIYIPLAGELHVGGLPLSGARKLIDSALRNYFNNPYVQVEIAEYRNRLVFVFGAVKIQGPLPITPGGMNLAQAIAGAQLRDTGYNLDQVRIIRSLSPTQGELLVVDFKRVMQGKALPMQLHEGDIIYVPKSAMGSWNDAITDILPSLQTLSASLQPFVNIKYLKN
jgi:polysaccharide export outer membrane protein